MSEQDLDEIVNKPVGELELPKGYTTVSELTPSTAFKRVRKFLYKHGLNPIKSREQLINLEDDIEIYIVIDNPREKQPGLLGYVIAGYIARKGDFELSLHVSKPQFASNYPITLEHPRGLILVKYGIAVPEVIFRTRRDGELMKDINSHEVNYFEVNDWAGRLLISFVYF